MSTPLIDMIADAESDDFSYAIDEWLESERGQRFVSGHPFRLEAMYHLAWAPRNAKTVAEMCDRIACVVDLLRCDIPLADNINMRSAVSALFEAETTARLEAIDEDSGA